RTAMSTTGTTPRTRAQRDPYLDNARGLLIALVVVGHTIESFENTEEALGVTLYMALYSFHMAAFIMISGFLSRSYRNEPRQVRRLLTAMVVPYVIFQMVHETLKALMLGRDLEMQLILPAWTLWFLVALLGWRLLSPLLRQLRYPLVFAVAISVIMPLEQDIGSDLSVAAWRRCCRSSCSAWSPPRRRSNASEPSGTAGWAVWSCWASSRSPRCSMRTCRRPSSSCARATRTSGASC